MQNMFLKLKLNPTVLCKSNESEFRRKSSAKQGNFEGHETWTNLLRIFRNAIVPCSKLRPCRWNRTRKFKRIFERYFEISESQSRIFEEEFDFSRERYRIFGKWFSKMTLFTRGFISTTIDGYVIMATVQCSSREKSGHHTIAHRSTVNHVNKMPHSLFYSGLSEEDSTSYQRVWQTLIRENIYPEQK